MLVWTMDAVYAAWVVVAIGDKLTVNVELMGEIYTRQWPRIKRCEQWDISVINRWRRPAKLQQLS